MRAAVLVIAVSLAPSVAFADAAAATRPPPDEIADDESSEANLESIAPRAGVTFAFAFGGGVLVGAGSGVGRGGALSFRVGHVATSHSVITFELSGTGALHKVGTTDTPSTDTNAGLFAGVQTYLSRATWVRLSGGPTVLTKNVGMSTQTTHGGIGALAGAGLDLARWGYFVVGLEGFGMTSVTSQGAQLQLGFTLGLSYY